MRWYPDFAPGQIKGVDVFLERSQTRQHVGVLDKNHQKFRFVYEDDYLKAKSIMPLGPEFPLTQKDFISDTLFPSLGDRLPDRDNPAYIDYCTAAGIAVSVDDPIILLATIGKRGPSSFIFEPIYKEFFGFKECEKWREELGLSMQDFANLFDVSLSILQKMKAGASRGKEVLQRLELYWRVPEALDYQIKKQGKWLEQQKYKKVRGWLENKMNADIWNPLGTDEVSYTQECLKRLEEIQQIPSFSKRTKDVKKIIEEQNYKDMNQAIRSLMFEARFADALLRAGLVFEYEKKAGVGNTNVDFCVNHNGKKWLIELKSMQVSDNTQNVTKKRGSDAFEDRVSLLKDILMSLYNKKSDELLDKVISFFGLKRASSLIEISPEIVKECMQKYGISDDGDSIEVLLRILDSKCENLFIEDSYKNAKEEVWCTSSSYTGRQGTSNIGFEIQKLQEVIMSAVFAKGRPVKFPDVQPNQYHVIIVDVRGFFIGRPDCWDYEHALRGSDKLPEQYRDGVFKGDSIKGLFTDHPNSNCKYLRKRIHAVGFVCEREYVEGEIETILQLFPNPSLITKEELNNLWPLRKHESYDPRNNPNRYSPPLHPDQNR